MTPNLDSRHFCYIVSVTYFAFIFILIIFRFWLDLYFSINTKQIICLGIKCSLFSMSVLSAYSDIENGSVDIFSFNFKVSTLHKMFLCSKEIENNQFVRWLSESSRPDRPDSVTIYWGKSQQIWTMFLMFRRLVAPIGQHIINKARRQYRSRLFGVFSGSGFTLGRGWYWLFT